jgi:N-ethylmaleimide reductase
MTETDLFSPYQLGPITLANRVVMAPLTRSRVGNDGVPTELTATYYGQRASAGLIVSEATNISQQGKGYAWTPGIWSPEQVEGWRGVLDAVHARGGHMVCQLWHVGRISHPSLQPAGGLPVAPSAIKPAGQAFTEQGFQQHVTPRPLHTDELPGIVEQYRHAARCAMAAGFDGVEIHGANGYLLDQFMRSSTNYRTDRYGGTLENRLRLTLEVAQAVADVVGANRTGIRISPVSPANDIRDADRADLVCFGRPFISNPDLVERLRDDAPLAEADENLFYGGDARGYIDYPALRRAA